MKKHEIKDDWKDTVEMFVEENLLTLKLILRPCRKIPWLRWKNNNHNRKRLASFFRRCAEMVEKEGKK